MSGLGQGTTSPGDISGIMQQLSDPNIQSGMAEFMGSEFGQQMLTSAAENNPQIRGLLDANPGMRYSHMAPSLSCIPFPWLCDQALSMAASMG